MTLIPRVFFFIVFLKLVERLKVLQAQWAKKALLHFTRAFKRGWITGGHDSSEQRRYMESARWEVTPLVHMIVGCEACAFHLHYARVNPWALKDKTKLINLAIINIKNAKIIEVSQHSSKQCVSLISRFMTGRDLARKMSMLRHGILRSNCGPIFVCKLKVHYRRCSWFPCEQPDG